MESLDDAISKRENKSLLAFIKLVDPEKRYMFDNQLIKAWNQLTLNDQRKLYLYLLYRKWRGLDIFGEPYFIIMNCHPVPFNWNGTAMCGTLIKEKKVLIAKHQGSYGYYTKDEINLYELEIKPPQQ